MTTLQIWYYGGGPHCDWSGNSGRLSRKGNIWHIFLFYLVVDDAPTFGS